MHRPVSDLAGYQVAPDAGTACQSCLVNSACSATRACAASTTCDAENRCVSACRTIDCFDACDVANGVDPAFNVDPDAGKGGVYGTYWTARSACSTQCEVGGDWSCVGHVSWPTPKSAAITWHVCARDLLTGAPTAGANVSVCAALDCAAPPTAFTDASGMASLHFQNMTGLNGLTFGLNGFLSITSPSIVPYYFYWGFPLSEAQINTNALVLTPAELQQGYAARNVPQDPNRGSVAAVLFDCQGNAAPGVLVTLDTADAMTQSVSPALVAATTTDSSGFLFFLNVPQGPIQLTATPVVLGKVASKVAAYVRAQANVTVLAYPTP